jgi:phosphatidylinositol glycan class W
MATNINNNDRRLDIFLPWILSSVNDFGLAVFLSSNVLTGLVNLTFDTLHSSNNKAMLILSVYLVLVCGFALFLDTFKRRREKID